jgi:hypothetical protein
MRENPPKLLLNSLDSIVIPGYRGAAHERLVTSWESDLNQLLSRALNRELTLRVTGRGRPGPANAEEYRSDMEGLE